MKGRLRHLHRSSRSRVEGPPVKRFLKKLCLGASGVSVARNKSPSISFKDSLEIQVRYNALLILNISFQYAKIYEMMYFPYKVIIQETRFTQMSEDILHKIYCLPFRKSIRKNLSISAQQQTIAFHIPYFSRQCNFLNFGR